MLQGASHRERLEKAKSENAVLAETKDYSKVLALLYMLMVYGMGFLFGALPEIYRLYFRGVGEKEFVQASSLPNGYKLICGLKTNE